LVEVHAARAMYSLDLYLYIKLLLVNCALEYLHNLIDGLSEADFLHIFNKFSLLQLGQRKDIFNAKLN